MKAHEQPPSTTRAAILIACKELRASFRDRQTALYAIVLPIALYPVLFWCLIQAAQVLEARRQNTVAEVGLVDGGALTPELQAALERNADPSRAEIERVAFESVASPADEQAARERLAEPEGPDAFLYTDPDALRLEYDSTRGPSSLAESRIASRLEAFAQTKREDAARSAGIDPRELDPVDLDQRDVAEAEDKGAYMLSFLLPMLLVIMAVMGAFFPAVDLTAGERERGTFETTLLLPVPRLAVHQGKILAVTLSALLATALNLTALALTAGHLWNSFAGGGELRFEPPLVAFLAISPLALLFAFFVSAVLTGVSALARSFQSGQALLGPVQMLFIVPAMAGAIPGLELTPATAMIPVVNVVLAFRSLLRGENLPLEYGITAACLLFAAAASTWLAVRLLSRENLLFLGGDLSPKRLFALFFTPAQGR
ncbi:MAG: ABC transporter permease [Planctomycetes bacterium]|nr:ABC transporter permease [Planctomycetota bacterium]